MKTTIHGECSQLIWILHPLSLPGEMCLKSYCPLQSLQSFYNSDCWNSTQVGLGRQRRIFISKTFPADVDAADIGITRWDRDSGTLSSWCVTINANPEQLASSVLLKDVILFPSLSLSTIHMLVPCNLRYWDTEIQGLHNSFECPISNEITHSSTLRYSLPHPEPVFNQNSPACKSVTQKHHIPTTNFHISSFYTKNSTVYNHSLRK